MPTAWIIRDYGTGLIGIIRQWAPSKEEAQ